MDCSANVCNAQTYMNFKIIYRKPFYDIAKLYNISINTLFVLLNNSVKTKNKKLFSISNMHLILHKVHVIV